MSERYKRNPNTECAVCKKKIYRRPFEIRGGKRTVYCSSRCYGISQRKERPCAVCGAPILSGLNKKTCSRICSNKQREGNKYKHLRLKDKVSHYKNIKLRLLKLRGKMCERCGYGKYEILQIHHKDRDKNNNELENLELICPNCHYEEHFLKNSWLHKV